MDHKLKQSIVELSDNPKIQAAGATFATASGMGTYLDYIPDMLGIIATTTGIILTWVMIRKGRLDAKKIRMEIKLMEKEHVCGTCIENRRKLETESL
jgi:hypothetical protein